MTKIDVREVQSDEYRAWDRLAVDSQQGTVFHMSDWIRTCASLSRTSALPVGYYEDDILTGGCLLYVRAKFGLLHFADSTARLTPYGGYLLPEPVSTRVREREGLNRSIILGIADEISRMGFIDVNIVNTPAFQDILPLTRNDWASRVYYTYMLPLVADVDSRLSKKVRWAVRKGEKNGIRIGKCYDPEVYWDLSIHTYAKQNRKPPYTKAFLTGMLEMIAENTFGEMWIARMPDGEAIAAEVITWSGRTADRWSAVSNSARGDTGATSLLLYGIFQDLWERGFVSINLMAANTPNLSTFVSSFNPELVPYYGIEKSRFGFGLVKPSLMP
ncbi:GNAT family N-acetyltransferase [Methanoculleus sp. FWC-SCC1]|uniref:GNAT family N-acetyltransferase n=1 Tax=Methanoculleus frigidifontis TaxID=2584085 RepID=A0ABT8M721_9EURY|nr:GNAT family N-acetyltransferase [Methanoculleus sp. FWC-SCC1]MDN7023716.1 GNAT family N-acetyltransferase [Methanoculleus sp. FWC-SCC1]